MQGCRDALVMGEVVIGELPSLPVFEPFLEHLVAADVKLPDFRRYTLEILAFVDVDPARLVILGRRIVGIAFFDPVVSGDGITGN